MSVVSASAAFDPSPDSHHDKMCWSAVAGVRQLDRSPTQPSQLLKLASFQDVPFQEGRSLLPATWLHHGNSFSHTPSSSRRWGSVTPTLL